MKRAIPYEKQFPSQNTLNSNANGLCFKTKL